MKFVNICIALFISINLSAVDNLRISDIRSLGMGRNGVTQSFLFNPALVVSYTGKVFCIDYFNRYGMKELGTAGIRFVYPNPGLSTGINISSFGYDEYRKTLFRLSVGKQLNEHWQIGVSFQYVILQTKLLETVPQQLSTDLGVLFIPVDKLLIGVLIMNFPSISIYKQSTDIKKLSPYSVQIGFQWEVINRLFIVGTGESNEETTLTGSVGMEYMPFDRFRIRSGLQFKPLQPALGIGYRLSRFNVDVAAVYHAVLGTSIGIGLCYSF